LNGAELKQAIEKKNKDERLPKVVSMLQVIP